MIDQLFQFLAKMGYSDPLHPPITHMPIGLTVGALVFFLSAFYFKRNHYILTARLISILAFIFAFPTILLGVIDWIHFYHAAFFPAIKIKMALAAILLIVLGTGIILGSEIKVHSITMAVLYIIAFFCVLGLGYYGSSILYGRGIIEKSSTVNVSPGPDIASKDNR
jgi:uncharacterized membrane protein